VAAGFSASERSGTTSCVESPVAPGRAGAWVARYDVRLDVLPAPRLLAEARRGEENGTLVDERLPSVRNSAQETDIGQGAERLSQQLKGLDRDAVAARAGIRRADTNRSPLTHRYVRSARGPNSADPPSAMQSKAGGGTRNTCTRALPRWTRTK
jgi:hypothetical protein